MKITLVPLNPTIADFSGNLQKILSHCEVAEKEGAELVVFPELSLVGYPPQDLALRTSFPQFAQQQLDRLAQELVKLTTRKNFAVIVGTVLPSPSNTAQPLINAAIFLQGDRREVRAKSLIPHYDIFHERRYFQSALDLPSSFRAPVEYLGKKIGILICEDSWHETNKYGRNVYSVSPSAELQKQGADFFVNTSASPYSSGKLKNRRLILQENSREVGLAAYYVNLSGANDEIIFDGDAFACDARGELLGENRRFSGEIIQFDTDAMPMATAAAANKPPKAALADAFSETHAALVEGIRDYACKNKFKTALLGLSGGIDSAVVAALAVDALGAENVFGFTLPSKFSSAHSLADGEQLAKNLGIRCQNLSIKFLQSALELALKPYFSGRPEDITEENLQARLRGVLLMAIANKFGHLLLATGNKSELAVGYSTLYGDMCGGLAPIGDLFKTDVYRLARYLNRNQVRIPQNSLEKAPSAELRPNQKDQDSLPSYAELDRMLFFLIEKEMSVGEAAHALKAEGLSIDSSLLRSIEQRVWNSEFKRNQFAPILRVSEKAFGIGRRYPISHAVPEF